MLGFTRSLSYPHARGNVSRFDSLLMELNHLLVSVQLLRSPPFSRSFDATRASRTPFLFQHGFHLFWHLLWHCLYAAQHAVFRPGSELTTSAHFLSGSLLHATNRRLEAPGERLWQWRLRIQMSDPGSLFPRWDVSQTTPRRFVPSDQLRHQWVYCFQGRKSTFHSAVRVSNSNHQPPPRAQMRQLAVGSV